MGRGYSFPILLYWYLPYNLSEFDSAYSSVPQFSFCASFAIQVGHHKTDGVDFFRYNNPHGE